MDENIPCFFWYNTKKYLSAFLIVFIILITISPCRVLATGNEGISISVKVDEQSFVIARFTLDELEAMKQIEQKFSSVDPMPAPSITLAKGVLLDELLRQANIDMAQIDRIKLTSGDGWVKIFTRESLLESSHYFFPDIVTAWEISSPNPPEFIPNAERNKKAVQPMLALSYFQERFNSEPDWSKLNSSEGIKFCYGQQNIEDNVMINYGKYIKGIELTLKEGSNFDVTANMLEETETPEKDNIPKTDEDEEKPKQRAGGSMSGMQGVPADSLTVMVGYYGGPYHTKKVFTLEELGQMPLVKQPYTFIDNMPAIVLNSAIGVKITDILEQSGIDVNSVEAFHFYCTDVSVSWYESMPKTYLLDTKRYYYPKLPISWDIDTQSATSGAKDGAQEVDAILTLEDNWQRFGIKPDFTDMDTSTRFRLVFGQTDTGTRTAFRSAKWIHAIEVMLGGTPPSGITLDKSVLDLEVGSVFQLNADIGIIDNTTDKRVEWKSSDPSIAKVDSRGRVKILGEGTAIITATTVVGDLSASCVINGPPSEESKTVNNNIFANEDEKSEHKNPEEKDTVIKEKSGGIEGTEKVNDDKQYLQEIKKGVNENLEKAKEKLESGVQPWRVYEMSSAAVALPNIKELNALEPYEGSGAIAFFCLGAVIRFKKYRNEI